MRQHFQHFQKFLSAFLIPYSALKTSHVIKDSSLYLLVLFPVKKFLHTHKPVPKKPGNIPNFF